MTHKDLLSLLKAVRTTTRQQPVPEENPVLELGQRTGNNAGKRTDRLFLGTMGKPDHADAWQEEEGLIFIIQANLNHCRGKSSEIKTRPVSFLGLSAVTPRGFCLNKDA